MKIIFIISCSGMFRDVPGCSEMFRHVPECYVFRVLSTASEMNDFCLQQGKGLKASAAHPYPNFP